MDRIFDGKMGINDVMHIKRMTRNAGLAYAQVKYGLTAEELVQLEAICKFDTPTTTIDRQYDHHKRKFMAAVWLLGASYRQIGRKVGGIAAQTVMQALDREFKGEDRKALRLNKPGEMSEPRLQQLHTVFYQMVATNESHPFYEGMSPLTLASVLNQIPPEDDDSEAMGDYATGEIVSAPSDTTQAQTQSDQSEVIPEQG